MGIGIKMMETADEIKGKAYVHWKAWHEAYPGIVSGAYLDAMTLERCEDIAFKWPDNIIVAKDGGRVVGFSSYGDGGDDIPGAGEVYALYILSEYYGTGLGRRLMDAALERLREYAAVCLWVLKDNHRAVSFYRKAGFVPDGTEKYLDPLGAAEIRMVKRRS